MKTTMPEMFWHLMDAPSVRGGECAVCGRAYPLNDHHVVFRSQGKLFRDGKEVEKPTIRLCGVGNNLKGVDGREFCHGKAHHGLLHFDFRDGKWLFLATREPCKYQDALAKDGWLPLRSYGSIECDKWEIAHGDIGAFRKRWGMEDIDMEEAEKRRATGREYIQDILGIGYDG